MAPALAKEPKPQPGQAGESRRRCASGQGCSEHPHLGLGTEHPLLIGSQDQGLLAGHVVRLGADVALAIEEEHPQQLAGGNTRRCTEMMRIGQERLRGVAAMAGLANDTAVEPRRRQRRARVAQRLASALARCASRGRPGGVIARAQVVSLTC